MSPSKCHHVHGDVASIEDLPSRELYMTPTFVSDHRLFLQRSRQALSTHDGLNRFEFRVSAYLGKALCGVKVSVPALIPFQAGVPAAVRSQSVRNSPVWLLN
jgi:hypothetical protein